MFHSSEIVAASCRAAVFSSTGSKLLSKRRLELRLRFNEALRLSLFFFRRVESVRRPSSCVGHERGNAVDMGPVCGVPGAPVSCWLSTCIQAA